MALSAAGIRSQRQGNLFVLNWNEANVGGADYASLASLPTGFGDVKVYELAFLVTGLGAGAALNVSQGVNFQIRDGTSNAVLDQVGAPPLVQVSVSSMVANCKLEVVRLWRQTEQLLVQFPDLETATTTGDVDVFALVQRLRDVGAVA